MFFSKFFSVFFQPHLLFICRRPDETRQDQRQQSHLKKQDFAASAEDPMNLAVIKGSNLVSKSICCSPAIPGANQKAGATAPAFTRSLY